MAYKMKNPYPKMGTKPISRKGEIDNKGVAGNTAGSYGSGSLKDGRSKSAKHQ